uniref:Uncharacterized protein n=1 Tax=Lutzomyia longipalpis TaxID=7200 RepID=A0A1B0CKQ3_LUTLO
MDEDEGNALEEFSSELEEHLYSKIHHGQYRLELQRKLPWLAIHEKEISDSASVTSVATTESFDFNFH